MYLADFSTRIIIVGRTQKNIGWLFIFSGDYLIILSIIYADIWHEWEKL